MQFTIRFSGGKRSDFGDYDYEDILSSALDRFRHRLKQVYLYLEDVNGPRGGVDKQCRCVLHLRRMPPVVIQDQDDNMNALIHRVANRASYAISQRADRKSKGAKHNRRPRKQPLFVVTENGEQQEIAIPDYQH
ncbi:MAG: hypothetical protein RIC12_00650 [Pirellulales bacterium]